MKKKFWKQPEQNNKINTGKQRHKWQLASHQNTEWHYKEDQKKQKQKTWNLRILCLTKIFLENEDDILVSLQIV